MDSSVPPYNIINPTLKYLGSEQKTEIKKEYIDYSLYTNARLNADTQNPDAKGKQGRLKINRLLVLENKVKLAFT